MTRLLILLLDMLDCIYYFACPRYIVDGCDAACYIYPSSLLMCATVRIAYDAAYIIVDAE